MKITKNIIYVLVLALTIYSCDNEYDKEVILNETASLEGTIELVGGDISAPGQSKGFLVTLPEAFDKKAQLTVKAVGKDFTETLAIVDMSAGATSAEGTIVMPNVSLNTFDKVEDYAYLQIVGIATGDDVTDADGDTTFVNDPNDNVRVTSNTVSVSFFQQVQWVYGSGVVAGRMTVLFDWANPGANDLDMYMFSSGFAQVEGSGSGSRYETDIFNDTHPDGSYFVAIDFYTASGDIPWKLFFVHPDQITVSYFEGVFVDAAGGDFVYPVVNFTKMTDADGVVSYVFELP